MRAYFADAAGTAAKFLAREDGPHVGALAFDGWDTHVNFSCSTNAHTLVADAVVATGAMPARSVHEGNVDGAFVNHDPTLPSLWPLTPGSA
ncbi:MAG TPA: hypothetical protein VGM07_16375 [Stellaceae bacterium]